MTKLNGKEVYKSNYRIDVLSDYTASIKDDEAITIINYSGDVLYDKVTEMGQCYFQECSKTLCHGTT